MVSKRKTLVITCVRVLKQTVKAGEASDGVKADRVATRDGPQLSSRALSKHG